MQKIDDLLNEIGFSNVRSGDREHLKKVLIPQALLIKNADDGRGVLTTELAQQISRTAREIRKGLVEAADKVTLYDKPDNSDKWPSQFDTKLLWTAPWWLVVVFISTIGLSFSFTETKIYSDIKELFSSKKQTSPSANTGPGGTTEPEKKPETLPGG
jgi:hypothetical protein